MTAFSTGTSTAQGGIYVFFGTQESTSEAEKNAQELIYRYMQREIEVDNARDIEFQRVHRMRLKKLGSPQPIISRFFLFHDRQRVFKRALDVKDETCKDLCSLPRRNDSVLHSQRNCSVLYF